MAKPAIDLQKKADPTIRPGGTVTFTLVVRNTGNVDLADVDVTDPAYPACARKFPRLPVMRPAGMDVHDDRGRPVVM